MPGNLFDVFITYDENTKHDFSGMSIVSESLLRFNSDVFTSSGGFALSGDVVIGQKAEQGTISMLRSGRFETREKPIARNDAYLVDEGKLSLGDVIAIEPGEGDDSSSTYVFVTKEQDEEHFRVVAMSEEGRNRLSLSRAMANKVFLEPSWSDRLGSDPFILAVTTLMGLIPAVFSTIGAFLDRNHGGSGAKNEAEENEPTPVCADAEMIENEEPQSTT